MKKKHVHNIKPVPRSVSNNTQELRMTLPNQVHSPSPVWLYHSNWSDDLSPSHVIPPNGHQSCSPSTEYQKVFCKIG